MSKTCRISKYIRFAIAFGLQLCDSDFATAFVLRLSDRIEQRDELCMRVHDICFLDGIEAVEVSGHKVQTLHHGSSELDSLTSHHIHHLADIDSDAG
jgi:hypothetical protein